MKSKFTPAAIALLCAAGLAACGGSGSGSLQLGVQVQGLDRSGLVVQNGSDTLELAASGLFFFNTLLAPDASFNVTVKSQPSGSKCTASNNTGKINYYTYTQTVVTCVPDPYILGGTVSGLKGGNLVLANGEATAVVQAGATTFEFPNKIANGAPYGVTVLSAPAGLSCTVSNGSGFMPQANITNVAVTCQ